MKDDLYFRRQDFNGQSLSEKEIPLNPHALFRIWLDEALLSDEPEPNAMNIVSVSEEGNPHARIVLLRQADDLGFTFFTNYNSGKGKHWSKNPKAAATFFWPSLYRQVRIEGNIEKISREESVQYFDSRPLESRISAIVSPQSSIIPSADWLMEQFSNLAALGEKNIICPDHWGGYILKPVFFEFWLGKPYRLHDRIEYNLQDKEWKISRLAP